MSAQGASIRQWLPRLARIHVALAAFAAAACLTAAVRADQTATPQLDPSTIAAPGPSASADAHPPVPDVARRLWHDLLCLCGECSGKTLEACECSYAADRREEILQQVVRMGFGTPAKDEATYALVARDYVVRHKHDGDAVRGRIGWAADLMSRPIVALGAALAAFVVLIGFVEISRRKRAAKSSAQTPPGARWKKRGTRTRS